MLEKKLDNPRDVQRFKNSIMKINPEKIINEAVNMCRDTNHQKKNKKHSLSNLEKYEKEEFLEELKDNQIKLYLESVKDKTIKEIKGELEKHINDYIDNVKIILMKSKFEVEEYKKKLDRKEEEYIDQQNKVTSLVKCNGELISEIKNYQSNLRTLSNNYDLLCKQKDLFEVILQEYSSTNSPDSILQEIRTAKKGTLQMLNDYNIISAELDQIKKNFENLQQKYENKLVTASNEYHLLEEIKKNSQKKDLEKINDLTNKVYEINNYRKENFELRQILYYLYNLLFEQFNLKKNVLNINKKFLNIKESDFDPNIIYNTEIKNYIALMIQFINNSTAENLFRECIGYLNVIIRNYFPSKQYLRFKPIEMIKEINDFINNNMGIINGNKNVINQLETKIANLENENFKLHQKVNNIVLEHNSYQKIIERQYNRNLAKNHLAENKKLSVVNLEKEIKKIGSKKNKSKSPKKENDKKNDNILECLGKSTILSKKKSKDKKNDKIYSVKQNLDKNSIFEAKRFPTRNKSANVFKCNSLKQNINSDKLIIKHGKTEEFKHFTNLNFLIDETNRLLLYKPKMNSYNNDMNNFLTENQNKTKTNSFKYFSINKEKDDKKYQEKINKKINKIIKAIK